MAWRYSANAKVGASSKPSKSKIQRFMVLVMSSLLAVSAVNSCCRKVYWRGFDVSVCQIQVAPRAVPTSFISHLIRCILCEYKYPLMQMAVAEKSRLPSMPVPVHGAPQNHCIAALDGKIHLRAERQQHLGSHMAERQAGENRRRNLAAQPINHSG